MNADYIGRCIDGAILASAVPVDNIAIAVYDHAESHTWDALWKHILTNEPYFNNLFGQTPPSAIFPVSTWGGRRFCKPPLCEKLANLAHVQLQHGIEMNSGLQPDGGGVKLRSSWSQDAIFVWQIMPSVYFQRCEFIKNRGIAQGVWCCSRGGLNQFWGTPRWNLWAARTQRRG